MNQFCFDCIPGNLPGGFFVYRATGKEELCFADKNVLDLYGCETEEEFCAYTGNTFPGMIYPDDRERVESEIYAQTFACGERHDYVHYRILTKQGEIRYVEDFGHLVYDHDGCAYFYVFAEDVEEAEYHKMNQADWEARVGYRRAQNRNVLTGLMFEKAFYSACEQNLANVKINWILFAIDLQHFKLFNEWYGREAGDNVLSAVGHELGRIAKEQNGVAGYFGSDDFALLVPASHFDADALFDRIHEKIVRHGASVGFQPAIGASYSQGNTSAYTLYDQASLACHENKADLRTKVMFFSQAMVSRAEEDYKVLSEFKKALANNEITFFLQPQCRSATGQIVGAEALSRWVRPDGRMVPPVSFIPTLERYGFVTDLDCYIWEQVCQWSRRMLDAGRPLIPVSLNISPVDIFTMDVPAFFDSLIEKYRLPKDAVKMEITESAYSKSSEKIRTTVQALRDAGFVVLMDDFGSGFSSLNMLRELNVDIIKLDAYFLRMDKSNEKKGMHIIESVVNMAKTMAMPVIVEGVETKAQCQYLMDLGIRYIQGYYFYKPMPAAEFEKLIAKKDNLDLDGFVFKANEEFRIREFLNDTVYSDSMLNHILGPAAIYSVHGDDIDIVRFNQMFYQTVNVPDFSAKLLSIQKLMPEHEVPELFDTLNKAYNDRLNGANGVFTFRKIDGTSARFLIHFYYLNEDGGNIRYYGAARDVTEITNLQYQMELLSRFTSRTILFLRYNQGEYSFDVAANGLGKELDISSRQMLDELNADVFYKRFEPMSEYLLWNVAQKCAECKQSSSVEVSILGNNGRKLDIIVSAEYVDDEQGDIRCILSLRKK